MKTNVAVHGRCWSWRYGCSVQSEKNRHRIKADSIFHGCTEQQWGGGLKWLLPSEAIMSPNVKTTLCFCVVRFWWSTSISSLSSLLPLFLLLRWDSSSLQAEDNQPSPHLIPGLSPALKLVAGLQKEQLLACFHKYIAMVSTLHLHFTYKSCVLM